MRGRNAFQMCMNLFGSQVVAIHFHHYKFGASSSLLLSTLVNSSVVVVVVVAIVTTVVILSITMFYIFIALSSDCSRINAVFIPFYLFFWMMCCLFFVCSRKSRYRANSIHNEMWRMTRASNNKTIAEKTASSMQSIRKYLKKRDLLSGRALFRFFSVEFCLLT